MKNTNVLELTCNLEQIVSANDDVIKNYEIFIKAVLYNGTPKDIYVETGLKLYNKQKTKNTIYQSHYWLHCTDKIFFQLSLTSNK